MAEEGVCPLTQEYWSESQKPQLAKKGDATRLLGRLVSRSAQALINAVLVDMESTQNHLSGNGNQDLARKNLLRSQLQIYSAHSGSVGRINAIQ
jgi:hypothetical protein